MLPFIIDERTDPDILFDFRINGERCGRGQEQRDYRTHPTTLFAPPSNIPLIPRSEWDARIDEQEERQSSLEHLRGTMPALDQNGQPYCWMYSVTTACQLVRKSMGLTDVRLSGHAGACMLMNYQQRGGWCGLGAQFAKDVGLPSVEMWPEKSMSRGNDKPEVWENAKRHRVLEDWVDLDTAVYDRTLSEDMLATLLLSNQPCPIDIPAWSHSICAFRWVRIEKGHWGPKILNSWTDAWGVRGTGILQGQMAKWMSAVCLRVLPASDI